MAPVKIKDIVSFSSQDAKNCIDNLLTDDTSKRWLCATNDKSGKAEVEVQLERACVISHLDIGTYWAFTVQVMVGRSSWPQGKEYVTLLPSSMFMTPVECKMGQRICGMKMFKKDDFAEEPRTDKWDRLKVTCTQPFRKDKQLGLSLLRVITADNEESVKTSQTATSTSLNRSPLDRLSHNEIAAIGRETSSRRSSEDIKKHFFGQLSPRTAKTNELKSSLAKIGASAENRSSEEVGFSRNVKLVLAAKETTPKYKLPSKRFGTPSRSPLETPPPKRRKLTIEDEIKRFLNSLDITKLNFEEITVADLRHQLEKQKFRKLSKDEKKLFFHMTTDFIENILLQSENETLTQPVQSKQAKLPSHAGKLPPVHNKQGKLPSPLGKLPPVQNKQAKLPSPVGNLPSPLGNLTSPVGNICQQRRSNGSFKDTSIGNSAVSATQGTGQNVHGSVECIFRKNYPSGSKASSAMSPVVNFSSFTGSDQYTFQNTKRDFCSTPKRTEHDLSPYGQNCSTPKTNGSLPPNLLNLKSIDVNCGKQGHDPALQYKTPTKIIDSSLSSNTDDVWLNTASPICPILTPVSRGKARRGSRGGQTRGSGRGRGGKSPRAGGKAKSNEANEDISSYDPVSPLLSASKGKAQRGNRGSRGGRGRGRGRGKAVESSMEFHEDLSWQTKKGQQENTVVECPICSNYFSREIIQSHSAACGVIDLAGSDQSYNTSGLDMNSSNTDNHFHLQLASFNSPNVKSAKEIPVETYVNVTSSFVPDGQCPLCFKTFPLYILEQHAQYCS